FKENNGLRDEGGFFSPEAIRKAREGLAEMHQRHGKDLVVETFKEIPADRKKDYKAADRSRFFEAWARERMKALHVDGVYALVCREPTQLEVYVSEGAGKKAFTRDNYKQLLELLLKTFRARKFDEGLLEAVKLVDARLKTNLGENGGE